jgi:signal transduction histidine kinase
MHVNGRRPKHADPLSALAPWLTAIADLARTEERTQLARTLHDTIAQSLAGTRLRLESAAARVHDTAVRAALLEVEQMLATDQREVRSWIEQLRGTSAPASMTTLGALIQSVCDRIEREWTLRVRLHVDSGTAAIPARVASDVSLGVREALVNVARHAHASTALVNIQTAFDGLRVTISDNGRGFPFRGRWDHARLIDSGMGPRSLCERVAALGGAILIDSTDAGATIELSIPCTLSTASARFGESR